MLNVGLRRGNPLVFGARLGQASTVGTGTGARDNNRERRLELAVYGRGLFGWDTGPAIR
jgi:hypothetical protein